MSIFSKYRRHFIFPPWQEIDKVRLFSTVATIIIVVFFIFYGLFWKVPTNFPTKELFTINDGSGLSQVANQLDNKSIIKSKFWFKTFAVLLSGPRGLRAGDYVFDKPENIFIVTYRLTHSEYGLTPIKITIPEGLSVHEIGQILDKDFVGFDVKSFEYLAKPYEGYLFPDTYSFLPNTKPEQVIKAMRDNFDEKIMALNTEITNFKRPIKDVITMASIIEEEARTTETRRTIAGILWKRFDEGMLLQVDATFAYIKNGPVPKVYLDDLKIDSPYNTYLYKGLPPTPISNPGLDAIKATITPITSKYYFYLSDKNGVMHYAVTHDEHLANKAKYLQ